MSRYMRLALVVGLSAFLLNCPSAPKPPEKPVEKPVEKPPEKPAPKMTVAAPAISPEAGTYTEAVEVTMETSTEGAEIHYTLDGTAPSSTAGTLYDGPFSVDATTTVQAIATRKDWIDSPIVKATYTITGTVADVTFNPEAGAYDHVFSVTLGSETPGARIYYTLDGSEPTPTTGTEYTDPVEVAQSLTIKAMAAEKDWKDSGVTSAEYSLTLGTVVAPVFSPAEGTYVGPQEVEITTRTDGATIVYTTDGSLPGRTNGTEYMEPVTVSDSETLKAMAYKPDFEDSLVISSRYVIKAPVAPVEAITDDEVAAARGALARAKEADADYYDPGNYMAARRLLDEGLALRMSDAARAREDLSGCKERADLAFENSVQRAAEDLGRRMDRLNKSLLAVEADKFLPAEYEKATAGIGEARGLYESGDLSAARARAYETLKAMADLLGLLENRQAWVKILKRDTEQYLKEAEKADAAIWAPEAKEKANTLYLAGLEAYQAYRLDDAEENYGSAREAAKDALRLARDNKAAAAAEDKKKTEDLRLQAMKELQDASQLTVVTEDGTIIKPEKWSGEDVLKQLEQMEQQRKEQQQKNQGDSSGDTSLAIPRGGDVVVLADEAIENLLTQAKDIWKLGLEEESRGNYAKAQEYYQEAMRYVEVYKSYAVKGVYTVRLIPENRDCLWKISGYDYIYANPRLWPRIWRRNRKLIQNPDLIQPGWELVIPPQ